jgi:hypothetical protein
MFGIKKMVNEYRNRRFEEAQEIIDSEVSRMVSESLIQADIHISGIIKDIDVDEVVREIVKNTMKSSLDGFRPKILVVEPCDSEYELVKRASMSFKRCKDFRAYILNGDNCRAENKERAIAELKELAVEAAKNIGCDAVFLRTFEDTIIKDNRWVDGRNNDILSLETNIIGDFEFYKEA